MKKDYAVLYNLLIECCRHELDATLLEIHASKIDNWDAFLNSAYVHGIFPLVHRSLKSVNTVPDKIKSKLKSINFEISSRNLAMTAELLKIMKLLEENSIPALAIKGPVLSQMIYGDITQRQYADIDILVDKNDMYDSVILLTNKGYNTEHAAKFLKNSTLLNVTKDFTLSNSINNIYIEFHWQLFLKRQLKNSKIELFSASNPIYIINNQSIKTLSLDTNLFYLLIHGSKHHWERLEWIVDIDRIIRQYNDINWDILCSLAKDMKIESMFYLGLDMSLKIFKTPFNDNMISRIHTYTQLKKITNLLFNEIINDRINESHTRKHAFENLYRTGLMKDNLSSFFRYYFLTLFQIKDYDIYTVNLPNYLWPLYYIIRIYRLFKFYVLRSNN